MLDQTFILVGVLALIVLSLAVFLVRRIQRVPPNEALVVVGTRGAKDPDGTGRKSYRIVTSGRTFVWPILEQAYSISLEQRAITFKVSGPDKNYIQTQVQATALFKVAGTNQGIYNAAQRFLDQQDEIDSAMAQALEGALRGIIATMPVDELISKREAFQALVVEQVEADLAEQGLQLDILNLSDITTPDSTYLKDRGRAQAAEAKQKAEEAEARTRLASEQARIEADERIAERERDLALKQATIQAETDRARAAANAAGDLARAEQDTLVAREQQAALAERTKVTESELDITVRKPAEAQAYAEVEQAKADRDAAKAKAEAEAFTRTTQAEANKVAALLDAEATKASGLAQAEATRAIGEAEAAATKAQAQALAEQGQAVLAQQLIEVLPEVVAAAAKAYENVDGLTIVSTEGATSLSKGVAGLVTEGGAMLDALIPGFDLAALVGGKGEAASSAAPASGTAAGADSATAPTV